ncbi:MAG: ATP-binding protein [Acidobacteriota bacterium]|nr:ATP-binding protein [Acidobacteriota bacterium]
MDILPRLLNIKLPARQSAFLWGPRKTGKSTFLKHAFPSSVVFDFLKTDVALDFTKRPALLREQILAKDPESLKNPIILDEVQKVPGVLDEVHGLIESHGLRFILCGSSARKLKRGKANLLGGRAWRYEMFPLVTSELEDFDLLKALNRGMIPSHYFQETYRKSLSGYIQDYLKEEVFAEGLTRNIPGFARFFDAMGASHGELLNFANIGRDAGIDAKTVREYFQILVDTLLGRMVEPFTKKTSRQILTKAVKFYLFDVGVAGAVIKRHVPEERGSGFGRAFEHFILMELAAHASYRDLHYPIRYWRTKTGHEVDFVLGDGEAAVEVKGSRRVDSNELKSLDVFLDEYGPKSAIVVCNEREERRVGRIRVMPWRRFLSELWDGKIIR